MPLRRRSLRERPAEVLRLTVASKGPLAARARIAASWRARLVGLLGRCGLPAGEALVFPACNSIHTFGMRFPIDALFVDGDWRVVALRESLRPWRLVWPVRNAWGVIELPSGALRRAGVAVGDRLCAARCRAEPAPS